VDDIAFRLLDWVCQNVDYRSDNGEYWFFPDETLRQMAEDCDGSAILLASMLRQAGYTPDRVYVVIGTYRGLGHAWVELDGKILETTYTSAHTVPDPHNYNWLAAFNDVEVIERYPRATSQLFQLARNEGLKLSLMAEAVNGR